MFNVEDYFGHAQEKNEGGGLLFLHYTLGTKKTNLLSNFSP